MQQITKCTETKTLFRSEEMLTETTEVDNISIKKSPTDNLLQCGTKLCSRKEPSSNLSFDLHQND
jgi:hypothetical protein